MAQKIVTAGIIRREGSELILLTRRGPGEKLAGLWEFPGGKVEPGETEKDCLKRELLEELGIETKIGPFLAETQYRYEHGEFLLRAYLATLERGEITLDVHDQFNWVDVGDIQRFPLAPADIPIAQHLLTEELRP